MYTHILVPIDGSPFSERALPLAAALARVSDARVELVHVHEPRTYASGVPQPDRRLDSEIEAQVCRTMDALNQRFAAHSDLETRLTCLEGPVAPTLERHASRSGADLVVMATHGEGGLSRAWLGSVADHMVRHSAVPILLVRPGAIGRAGLGEPLFRRIVVPLDGSSLAETALDHAVMFATPGATEFVLVQVIVPERVPTHPYPMVTPPIDQDDVEERSVSARAYLAKLQSEIERAGFVTTATVIVQPRVARAILDFSEKQDADLIALSTHGRGAVARLFLGSVADKILRAAKRPLLLYRPSAIASTRAADEGGADRARGNATPRSPSAA